VALAERGADVVLVDRCADSAAVPYPLATAADLAETEALVTATGRRCLALRADVGNPDEITRAVADAVEAFGGIDIAVANAGVSVTAPLGELVGEKWDEVIATNLTGVFHTIAAVSGGMAERGYGRIIAVSSMMGRSAAPGMAAYSASKWGVIGIAKSAALELAQTGVTVNVVAPGNISTPMVLNDALYSLMRPDLENPGLEDVEPVLATLHAQPVALLQPEEVTRAVLFFADEGSNHITGTVLPIDAGAAARVSA